METALQSHRRIAGALTWAALGLLVLGFALWLLALAPDFAYGRPIAAMPILSVTALSFLAGGLTLLLPWATGLAANAPRIILWVIAVGLLARLLLLDSTAILEDDFYRYLWDGAVAAQGLNPYRLAPAELPLLLEQGRLDPAYGRLLVEGAEVHARINHPALRTVYPGAAQAVFALTYWLDPWSLSAWRLVLLAFEGAGLLLLLLILRDLGRSPLWAALYWWNPLAIREIANAAHMEGLLVPILLLALFLTLRRRPLAASLVLALATAIKLWPVLLLPIVLRPLLGEPRRLLAAVTVFAVPVAILMLPVILAGLDRSSGFLAYGERWEMNDAAFMLLAAAVGGLIHGAGFSEALVDPATRILVAGAIGLLALAINRHNATSDHEICRRFLIVAATLFLLSPTQFPWYLLWLLPFLPLVPNLALLLLTPLLALYSLRFYFVDRYQAEVFDHGIVWLEFLPVWALLGWQAYRQTRQHRLDPRPA